MNLSPVNFNVTTKAPAFKGVEESNPNYEISEAGKEYVRQMRGLINGFSKKGEGSVKGRDTVTFLHQGADALGLGPVTILHDENVSKALNSSTEKNEDSINSLNIIV